MIFILVWINKTKEKRNLNNLEKLKEKLNILFLDLLFKFWVFLCAI